MGLVDLQFFEKFKIESFVFHDGLRFSVSSNFADGLHGHETFVIIQS